MQEPGRGVAGIEPTTSSRKDRGKECAALSVIRDFPTDRKRLTSTISPACILFGNNLANVFAGGTPARAPLQHWRLGAAWRRPRRAHGCSFRPLLGAVALPWRSAVARARERTWKDFVCADKSTRARRLARSAAAHPERRCAACFRLALPGCAYRRQLALGARFGRAEALAGARGPVVLLLPGERNSALSESTPGYAHRSLLYASVARYRA